jgi:hypothetical protein
MSNKSKETIQIHGPTTGKTDSVRRESHRTHLRTHRAVSQTNDGTRDGAQDLAELPLAHLICCCHVLPHGYKSRTEFIAK